MIGFEIFFNSNDNLSFHIRGYMPKAIGKSEVNSKNCCCNKLLIQKNLLMMSQEVFYFEVKVFHSL